MDFEIGIVCAQCDMYSALGAGQCSACGSDLALFPKAISAPPRSQKPRDSGKPIPRDEAGPRVVEERIDVSFNAREDKTLPSARAPVGVGTGKSPIDGSTPGRQYISGKEVAGGREAPAREQTRPRERPVARAYDPRRDETSPSTGSPPRGKSPAPGTPAAKSTGGTFRSAQSKSSPAQGAGAVEVRPRLASRPDAEDTGGTYNLYQELRPRKSDPGNPAPNESPMRPGQLATPQAARKKQSLEELMEQAKSFVCRSCSTPVPMGHKFCGRCGAGVPPEIIAARTQFFGQLQAPGKAKLILIRGEGVEGLSYQLNAEQHIVGRNGQLVFPDDPFVSPKHANLFYRNNKLVVRDEGSLNGVYLRVRGTVDISPGDSFLAGEQLFRVDATPKTNDGPAPDGTYFYSSPKHQSTFRVTQILQGGVMGMTVCARTNVLQLGREGGDLNFPSDLYMSASHCKIEDAGGSFTLTDLNSRNGTYIRIKNERELAHGDYIFIGRKLLRVEITAA